MKCEVKTCLHSAEAGQKACLAHGAIKPEVVKPAEPEIQVVDRTLVPKSARFNEAAATLLAAVKKLPDGQALKVRLGRLNRSTCITAKRYAMDEALRIGVRFTSESAFLWKLTTTEIQKAENFAQRVRGKPGPRKKSATA